MTSDIIDDIISREGGFVDHPDDRGNATNYGITQQTLSIWLGWDASVSDVRALTKSDARKIYHSLFVTHPQFDQIADLPLRAQVIDAGVLHGTGWAAKQLQKIVGVEVDGAVGPVTLAAVNSATGLHEKFFSGRLHKIARIVQHDPTQLVFLVGWIDRATSVFLDNEGKDR